MFLVPLHSSYNTEIQVPVNIKVKHILSLEACKFHGSTVSLWNERNYASNVNNLIIITSNKPQVSENGLMIFWKRSTSKHLSFPG